MARYALPTLTLKPSKLPSPLLEKHTLDQLSITQICHIAGLNRGTFYLHYNKKEALYEEVIEAIIDDLLDDILSRMKKIRSLAHRHSMPQRFHFLTIFQNTAPSMQAFINTMRTHIFKSAFMINCMNYFTPIYYIGKIPIKRLTLRYWLAIKPVRF